MNFLRVTDLTPARLDELLDLAAAMKVEPNGWRRALQGQTLALCFDKPSTRTRTSFAAAAWRLGMLPLELRADELQLGRGESLEDTARALSGYVSAIVVRTHVQQTLEALAGVRVTVASPEGYRPHPDVVRAARAAGGSVELTDDPVAAVDGAHAVYTDTWVSMGQDAERETRLEDLAPYRLDERLLSHARPDAVVLHCLPAHRGEEIAADVLDGPRSVVWEQAANRLPTQQALLHLLLVTWTRADDEPVDLPDAPGVRRLQAIA